MEFKVHPVEWNNEKVKNFWNFFNNYKPFEDLWFSKQVGREIITFASKFVKIKGEVLDYGAGKGHLAGYLMESPEVSLRVCDFSDDTIRNLEGRFHGQSNFKGASLVKGFPSGYPENEFDVVFLVEAIEHLTDEFLLPTLQEIHRILKPGGAVIVTTPNDENLPLQQVLCPDCGCVFHRVQHVRSFDSNVLGRLMDTWHFNKVFCDAIDFSDYGKRKIVRKIKNTLRKTAGVRYKAPHLVYIGNKNGL